MHINKDVKKFVGTLYLYNGKCVKSISNKEVISENPVELAINYQDNNVDELLIFDLSKSDEEHAVILSLIRAICDKVEIPVIVAGNIKCFEDAKNLLYIGCSKVVLNFTREDNIEITKMLSDRFGKKRIMVALTAESQYELYKDVLEEYVSGILVMQDNVTSKLLSISNIQIVIPLTDIPLERLLDYLDKDIVSGVFGSIVNSNINDIANIKSFCNERGILTNGFIANIPFSQLKLNENGLIPCIVQDYRNNDVLMMAYMNEEAYNQTIKTGKMNYYSRSRNSQWLKGETSGHFQYVKSLYADCDSDTLLAKVSQVGAACHTGSRSCFFKEICKKDFNDKETAGLLEKTFKLINDRKFCPKEGSRTNELLDGGAEFIIENMSRVVTSLAFDAKEKNADNTKKSVCDLTYYMMVLMADYNITIDDIYKELSKR